MTSLQHALGDGSLSVAELEILEELLGLAESEIGNLCNVPIGDGDGKGDGIEPSPAACLTWDLGHVFLVVLPSRLTLG